MDDLLYVMIDCVRGRRAQVRSTCFVVVEYSPRKLHCLRPDPATRKAERKFRRPEVYPEVLTTR